MDMSHHEPIYDAIAMRRRILDFLATHPEADYNDMIIAFLGPLLGRDIDDDDAAAEADYIKMIAEATSIGMELAGEVTFTDGGRLAVRS
jgi:hypothetical protein